MGKKANKGFEDITWFDLESWAGSKIVSRGRSYQRSKYVSDLAITGSGELLAWVEGSATYATKVSIKGELSSVCSCPYYSACKHAVAVVLEYLDCLENGRKVPEAGNKDERLNLISRDLVDEDDDYGIFDDEIEDDIESAEHGAFPGKPELEDFLNRKSKSELIDLIADILERHDEVRAELQFSAHLKTAPSTAIAKTVEREIEEAAAEPAWWSYRHHTGHRADYSRVYSGLQRLLDEKHYDDVIRLGDKLLFLGTNQVEQSHDEGDTVIEIAGCMTIVFKALRYAPLLNEEKMERAVDFGLRDEYGFCDGLEEFWKRKFAKKDWSTLADRLMDRLRAMKPEKKEDTFSRDYRRDRLTDEIIRAMGNAGRQEEAVTLCLQEAEITSSYARLVKQLRKAGRNTEAEEWIRKGITATSDKSPGIANGLKEELLDMRRRKKDWSFVAAVLANDFFERPSLSAFLELKKASEKARVWEPVRKAVLQFLEDSNKSQQNRDAWPLPDTGLEMSGKRRAGDYPLTTDLIDIAIHGKRIDDVLKWYDRYKKNKQRWSRDDLEDRVADSIADSYPERAVGIWKEITERHVSQTGVNFYIDGARYLRKVKSTMIKNGEVNEWDTYLQQLKASNRRKPRLMETLDALSEKPIIRAKK